MSLGEGGTPLVTAERLGSEVGLTGLMLKDESRNPTGSFMDRGATVLLSAARASGVRELQCMTTGNLGASLAAYCAKAGVRAKVMVHPNTDREKLYQMIAFGAQVEGGPTAKETADSPAQISAANPYILEGEKTTGFEVAQDMGWKLPDAIFLPVGTGGHLSMLWRAMDELHASGLAKRSRCRLIGVRLAGSQAAGRSFTELESSEPALMASASAAMKDSGGASLETTSEETVRAIGVLARSEGIFAEPAAASAVSGLAKAMSEGIVRKDDRVVCIVTGAGLKDTREISRIAKRTGSLPQGGATPALEKVGGTKLAIIRLLSSRPAFGYSLWKTMSAEGAISTASIYQHLNELERLGLVSKAGTRVVKGRERVLYLSTKKGLEFLRLAGKVVPS